MSQETTARIRLLKNYSPKEKGTWRILGEDPNCDMGGTHIEPELCTVTGTYENVVNYALTLEGFFQWGAGGSIRKVSSLVNLDKLNSKQAVLLRKKKEALEGQIAELTQELQAVAAELEQEISD